MQKPTSDAHSNTYSINANFEGISYEVARRLPNISECPIQLGMPACFPHILARIVLRQFST